MKQIEKEWGEEGIMKKTRAFKWMLLSFLTLIILMACHTIDSTDETETSIEEGDTVIAAVGDSITAEYMSGANYPKILEEKLGVGYSVVNFGESNYAAQSSSDYPYETTASFEESLALEPDVVILMLGTNDTKAHNWNGADHFKEEYTQLLENYLEVESVSGVILASPPTVFLRDVMEGSIDPENIEPIRDVVQEVAKEYELEFVDMIEQTAGHSEWFFDGVHPTPEGAEAIAQIFYEQLRE